jgi:hypothetical protein
MRIDRPLRRGLSRRFESSLPRFSSANRTDDKSIVK